MACECKPKPVLPPATKRPYYRYYDTPEGCNIDKKMLATSRWGAIAGFLIGTKDVLLYSHAVGFGPIMRRYMYHMAPLILMGATFSAVANGLVHYRKADDHLNYFAGGFACGPILAAYLRSYHAVLLGGLFLGAIAAAQKEARIKDAELFPIPYGHMGSITGWRHNYNFLYPDPRDEMLEVCDPELMKKK